MVASRSRSWRRFSRRRGRRLRPKRRPTRRQRPSWRGRQGGAVGNVYRKKATRYLWMWWFDAAGARQYASTGEEDEVKARAVLKATEKRVAAEKDQGLGASGPVTVEAYAAKWMEGRVTLRSVMDDRSRMQHHVLPSLGDKELGVLTRRHVLALVREVRAKGLAPRTVRHVYALVRTMLSDAVVDGLLERSPCDLRERRGEIPAIRDADPRWRDSAVYSRAEVVALITDERIPLERRVLYAVAFVGAVRIGEASALQVRDWDGTVNPLGKLWVTKTFNHKVGEVYETTKTDTPRQMPVHPWLSTMLASWLAYGWARMYARTPRQDDLILPSPTGMHQRPQGVLRRLHADLDLLGFRRRRTHDARRTFISLARADGADKYLLQWVTHGRRSDMVDAYTTPPWDALCREVAKLKLELPKQEEETMACRVPSCDSGVTADAGKEKPQQVRELAGAGVARSTGLEPVLLGSFYANPRQLPTKSEGLDAESAKLARTGAVDWHKPVTAPHPLAVVRQQMGVLKSGAGRERKVLASQLVDASLMALERLAAALHRTHAADDRWSDCPACRAVADGESPSAT
ncbi:integrase Int [Myxococcus phage Mx8]|uniref:Integrase n=1 Tax=Myxococcus phage Mx8 TaxID=49964 RepID=O03963_9CAUD|nr:integrase Int [Myxococcus phage Mx8]AAC48895.1 integrase [Myxococcus phage Mx8]AAK94347.1 integrase Int [Myxococcus phage Mx8]QRG42409.1 integrase [Cloning vector pMYC20]